MKRLVFAALGVLVLAFAMIGSPSCAGGEEGSGSVSLDLDNPVGSSSSVPVNPTPKGEGAESAPSGQGTPKVSPDQAADTGSKPQPAAASTDAILLLDKWHRSLASERSRIEQGSSADAAAIAEFAKIWAGEAAAYRSRLGVAPVTRFGSEFEAYGRAFAKEGTVGLAKALKRGNTSGPAYLVWSDAMARISISEGQLKDGGAAVGKVLVGMLAAGYPRDRVLELKPDCDSLASQVASFLPAEDYDVEPNDSYWTICRKFRKKGIDAYQGWVKDYNGKRNYNLREGERLRIPTASLHLTAWRQARIAALFADGVPIRLYSISVGKQETPTPTGDFTIDICEKEPMWYPPEGGSIPFGNKDNPLGARWLGFKEDPSYAFHGNNSPDTLGGFESRGCIRMDNDEVIELFEMVGPGVKVTIKP